MAARDKSKAPAASKKGKQEKREQGEAPQPAGKPVEPETPVAQESLEPPEPPENWGSPFKPTAATTVSRAMREITLLLRIGSEQRILDVLAMPEFTVRLLWIMEKASEGKAMTIREGSMAEAAWSMLKAQTAAYMNAKLEDKTAYILDNPYGAYDPPTVSQYLENLPGIIERVGNLAYLKAEVLSEFKHWCQAVMVKNLEIFSDEDFVNEVYASGFHVISGDGNDYWRRRWRMEPDKWTKFHETFQKRCAELQEPMEAPAVGTVAPEAGERETEKKHPRSKRQSAHSGKGVTQIQLVKLLKEENLFYEQSTISKWEHGRGTPEGYPGRNDAVALKAWIGRFAEGVRMKKAMAKMVSYNDSVDYSRKRDDR